VQFLTENIPWCFYDLVQGVKFQITRSPLATKYFSLAIGFGPFFFSKLDVCEKNGGQTL
jgi:hypothetical protein